MASNGQQDPRNPSTPPQSIPLRDLTRPPDPADFGHEGHGSSRGRSLLSGVTRPNNSVSYGTGYERLEDVSPSPTERLYPHTGMPPPPRIQEPIEEEPGSPIENPAAFQAATGFEGFAGIDIGSSSIPRPTISEPMESNMADPDLMSPYSHPYPDQNDHYFHNTDSDRIPLTDSSYLQPMSGSQIPSTTGQSHDRSSFQSVRFSTPDTKAHGSRLGDDLPGVEAQYGNQHSRGNSFGDSLSPVDRRTSRGQPSAESPLSRAGSIMRAMSQRVVNLSNEPEPPELVFRRQASVSEGPPLEGLPSIQPGGEHSPYQPQTSSTPVEKQLPRIYEEPAPIKEPWPATNPFRGNSLGIFAPNNPIRIWLCDFLVHPVTEIAILVLIMLQTVLLAVESSSDGPTNPRYHPWGESYIDYAMLALFVIFTLEIMIRIIVSGFFFNAPEYSTIDKKKGIRTAFNSKYRRYFGPQRQASVRRPREGDTNPFSTSFARTITAIQFNNAEPTSAEEFQRQQLARRAFLRHSLNRIDFIAIVSFWISFLLSITGAEASRHLYVFKMLGCLRILRLLYLTNGTTIILKSLKKAAPLLVNVSFLIGFFWLLFAIIGVQAFKASFRRQCVWIDPLKKSNYTNNFTLCGGFLDPTSGTPEPWVYANGTSGATSSKGYLCPRNSLCIEQMSLYNGTVSFDNIVNSLELVFVIMSANTFTDLMYYTTNSDYLPAALFFVGGIVIMMLWLTNLLIAVITSSFQVIREESKSSAFTADQLPVVPLELNAAVRKRISVLKYWYDKTAWIWIVIISFGLLCQSLRSASMSDSRAQFIWYSEVVVTFLLLIEVIFRFTGDWRGFIKKRRNLVDAAIAVITTIILLPPIRNSGRPYEWLTIFQIVRIYRVVWNVPMTRELIEKVLGNATGIGNLVLFVFLITFLVAILAVQLFRGDIYPYDINDNIVRVTFFSLWNAFLGMYQVLSSENWTTLLYSVTSFNNYLNTGWIGAAFLIGWFILSFFILINMFIAVIQENFDVSEDEKRLQQVKAFLQRKEMGSTSSNLALSTIFRLGRSRKTKDPLDYGQAAMEMLLKDAVVRDFLDEEMDPNQQNASLDTLNLNDAASTPPPGYGLSALWNKFKTRVWNREPNPFYSSLQFSGPKEALDPRAMAQKAVSATMQRKKAQRDFLARHPMYNTALFIFKPANPIRRLCQKIVGPGRGSERFDGVEPNKIVWYTFSAFIYATIVTMVILACVTTPLYQKDYFQDHVFDVKNWFVWTDMAFAAVFTIEALIKVVADGCFWTPNAYFRSLWGFIDALVLITLWINVVTSFLNDGAVSRAVGAFKALRALRLLNVSDSARETFNKVILVGGWRVVSAAFVSMALLIPFAIYGVNLFNGQMTICNDGQSGITNLSDCAGEWTSTPFSNDWGVMAPRVASNPYYDFDNFGGALFILFQIVSQEGWVDVMWSAESITGRGLQPQNYASQGNAIFFVVFNLMATVFVLTLFISVFMRTYTEQTGVAFLTTEQRSWMELRKLLRQIAPSKRPSNKASPKWKIWCYKRAVQKHGKWHRAITVTLVLHLLLLMLEFYPEPYWWTRARDYLFLLFTVFYMANTIIRIIGLTWPRFRRSSWDVYALLAVSGTLVTTLLLFTNFDSVTYNRLHKLFLVSITLLLIPRNNALDQLFKTAAASLTSIVNLLATWFVLFLVYAIAMTQIFGLTRFGSQGSNNLNLRTVPKALIILFRMSCGEGWNTIMEDFATIQPPFCVESDDFFNSDCGSPTGARVLFITWNILSMYIFVSLFVSLIYESFSYVYQRSSGLSVVTREETRRFKQAWAAFDPQGTGYISKENFPRLLGELSGVFAMRIYDPEDSVRRILEEVQTQTPGVRGNSSASTSQLIGVNLKALNERIARIDTKKVRQRRHRYNIFYQEVMVSADPDRGLSFTTVLMILAHYNVISDNKSLKLDEFLRRRARLQRVEEEVSRRVVVGFIDTIFWHRRFRRHIDRHRSARMTDIPHFEVPEIIVDDTGGGPSSQPFDPDGSPQFSATHMPDRNSAFRDAFGLDGFHYSESAISSPSRSPRLTPHRPTNSAYSFELQEPTSPHHSRQGSGVSAENVLEVFSESAWGESLRRSFTMRRSQGGPP